jgi:hypothetical protein
MKWVSNFTGATHLLFYPGCGKQAERPNDGRAALGDETLPTTTKAENSPNVAVGRVARLGVGI